MPQCVCVCECACVYMLSTCAVAASSGFLCLPPPLLRLSRRPCLAVFAAFVQFCVRRQSAGHASGSGPQSEPGPSKNELDRTEIKINCGFGMLRMGVCACVCVCLCVCSRPDTTFVVLNFIVQFGTVAAAAAAAPGKGKVRESSVHAAWLLIRYDAR